MTDYLRVLEGTEQHLRILKASGVRFLNVASETLSSLTDSPPPVSKKTNTSNADTQSNGQSKQNGNTTGVDISEQRGATPTNGQIDRRTTGILSYDRIEKAARGDTEPRTHLEQSASRLPEPLAHVILSYDSMETGAGMDELRQRAMACLKCPHLVKSRKNVVFGVGDVHARLMFVGEAPGADEDAQGEPFVGAAGQLLTRIIQTMGLSRETVYIANILKCRPDTPGQSFGNRKPTPDEMKTCLPYLLAQIDLIRPKVMIALGSTAVEGLLGKCESIGKLRGRFQTFREIPLMPTFHPAYLLRNQALTEKRKVWEDMLQVMARLEMSISEKQKSYFLKQ